MGWMQQLCQTYDNVRDTKAFEEDGHPLVPAGYIEKGADIHVVLTETGTFAYAVRFEKDERNQIIPSTPAAEGRVGGVYIAYPLCDELRYVAGDFEMGESPFFADYIQKLTEWCEQPDAPPRLKLLQAYLAQKRLVRDLRASGFPIDMHKDAKAFVCFSVQGIDRETQALWKRSDVRASWLSRLPSQIGGRALCYVEGQALPLRSNHPKVQGNAKLISAEDTMTPFQYKGRFLDAADALTVSYEASAKAHNALIWLMKRQGFDRYGLKIVAWSTRGHVITSPAEDDGSDMMRGDELEPDTFEAYGKALRDAARGYEQKLDVFKKEATDRVVILGMEAATNGRMSINYYQEMPGNTYVQRLTHWYDACKWEGARWVGDKDKRRFVRSIWTPTPLEIAVSVLGKQTVDIARRDLRGEKAATKLMRQLRVRIFKCIVEEDTIPGDIVQSAVYRASRPHSFTDKRGGWQADEWRLTLSVACALVRKQQVDKPEEGSDVKLDEGNLDRNYLYGRLLALADVVEYFAMDKSNYRQTNAVRYMQIFQQRPHETWAKLHTLAGPYMTKLGKRAEYFKMLIGEVEEKFKEGDRECNAPLEGLYLHGYYCQRQELFKKKEKTKGAETHGNAEQED